MTSPEERPQSTLPPVQYKGEPLDAERGPGLGCFWTQLVALAVLVVLTPLSVYAGWPEWLSAALLFATIAILLVAGQTIIFLLRLVAAERREGRRRPMSTARSRTVGELEDETGPTPATLTMTATQATHPTATQATHATATQATPATGAGPDRGAEPDDAEPGDRAVRE